MTAEFGDLLASCRQGSMDVCIDSRKVKSGDAFVAMPGANANGVAFAADAVKNGAKWLVCALPDAWALREAFPDCKVAAVQDPAAALWQLAQARWRTGNLALQVIGVTGTNGKTTCAWLLESLFQALGKKVGVLGTVAYKWPGYSRPASLTTPDALELHALLRDMEDAGVEIAIMEVSSHSLCQARVGGVDFSGAIFTNLTQDHLDYHHDMEAYFQAKAKLFLELPQSGKARAINGDDGYGRRLLEALPQALAFGLRRDVAGRNWLLGEIESLSPAGMRLRMSYGNVGWRLNSRLVGAFNASNLLAVQALALQMGVSIGDLGALESFAGVPGRLERIENPSGKHVFVDYAHTPDALVNALQALREAGFRRIITVFGCGGNRDRTKRPLMGKAVADYSDVAVLTSDNPRMEDPDVIMDDVAPGLAQARKVIREADRRAATAAALELLGADDALLIAGKGHEDYQIIGAEKRHYSDQEVARELLGCA